MGRTRTEKVNTVLSAYQARAPAVEGQKAADRDPVDQRVLRVVQARVPLHQHLAGWELRRLRFHAHFLQRRGGPCMIPGRQRSGREEGREV